MSGHRTTSATIAQRPVGVRERTRTSTGLTRSRRCGADRRKGQPMTTSDPIAPTTSVDALLTDEMLARFDERAPQYDRENRFFDEDFAELRASGLPVVRAAGRVRRRRARAARLHPAGPPARLRRPGDGAGREHARLLDRARRRPGADGRRVVPVHPRAGRRGRGLRRHPRRAGQRHAAAAVDDHGRAGRRRLGDQRAQDLRQPDAGVDLRRVPRHGQLRSRSTRRSCTASCPATRRASRSSTRGTRSACGPRRARTPSSTRRSAPTSCARSCARPGSPAPDRSTSAIFAWALTGFAAVYLGAGAPGVRHHAGQDADADVDRPHQLDGPPPRGAAPRRQDAHGLRRRRGAARSHGRRLGGRRRSTRTGRCASSPPARS